jgi:hypothetical protein
MTDDSLLILSFSCLNWQVQGSDAICIRGGENSDNAMFWSFGVDIATAAPISSYTRGITSEAGSFEAVRQDFQFDKGQKIGIAVYSKKRPTAKSASYDPDQPLDIDDDTLKRVYGKPKHVNIYTGEIMLVGETHIEHNINSYTVCSGAIIFLLDNNQPDSVKPDDFGKAIAVHAGSHPAMMTRNLGFKWTGAI